MPSVALSDTKLAALSDQLHANQQENSHFIIRNQRLTGEVKIQSFEPTMSKAILDQIDRRLADLFGLAAEELDFIINYDIKYRLRQHEEEDE
jgi:hypothetical protein